LDELPLETVETVLVLPVLPLPVLPEVLELPELLELLELHAAKENVIAIAKTLAANLRNLPIGKTSNYHLK